MDFIDAVHVLRRRWWMFVIGLVLVSGGVVAARSLVPVQYQASGLMLVLLPADAPEGNARVNPYLNLPEGLTTTASLIASEAVSDDVLSTIATEGHEAVYSVALVPDTGPLLTITAQHTDPQEAVVTRDAVMGWIDRRLISIQEPVSPPPSQLMYTTSTSVSTTAEVLPGSRLRAMAGAGAGGLVLLLVVVFVLDRLLIGRSDVRRRRDEAADADGGDPSSDEGDRSSDRAEGPRSGPELPQGQDHLDATTEPAAPSSGSTPERLVPGGAPRHPSGSAKARARARAKANRKANGKANGKATSMDASVVQNRSVPTSHDQGDE